MKLPPVTLRVEEGAAVAGVMEVMLGRGTCNRNVI